MKTKTYAVAVIHTRRDLIPLEDAARRLGLHPEVVRRFLEFGLIESSEVTGPEIMLDHAAVHRIAVIEHLRDDLGVNLPGVGVILELLDRIEALQRGRRGGRYGGGRDGYQ